MLGVKRLLALLVVGLAIPPAPLEPEAEIRVLAVRRADAGPLGIVPGEVIVGFGVAGDLSRVERAVLRLGARHARPGRFGGPCVLGFPSSYRTHEAPECR